MAWRETGSRSAIRRLISQDRLGGTREQQFAKSQDRRRSRRRSLRRDREITHGFRQIKCVNPSVSSPNIYSKYNIKKVSQRLPSSPLYSLKSL